VMQKITKRGSKIMLTGYYEGSWSFDGHLAPESHGTSAFFLMMETDPFARPLIVPGQQVSD